MSYDPARTSISDYDVTFGSYPCDVVDKVEPKLTLKTRPIKVGSIGDIAVGERIVGLEGTITVAMRATDVKAMLGIAPWSATAGNASPGTSGVSIPLVPTAFKADLYDYAKQLRLHPNNRSDTERDIVLKKAVARVIPSGARDGVNDDVDLVDFSFFPDRAKMTTGTPELDYGYVGSTDPNA